MAWTRIAQANWGSPEEYIEIWEDIPTSQTAPSAVTLEVVRDPELIIGSDSGNLIDPHIKSQLNFSVRDESRFLLNRFRTDKEPSIPKSFGDFRVDWRRGTTLVGRFNLLFGAERPLIYHDNPVLALRCNDGCTILNSQPFDLTGRRTVSRTLFDLLEKVGHGIPVISAFSFEHHDRKTGVPDISTVDIAMEAWGDEEDNCYTVLTDICTFFGMQLFMANGTWYVLERHMRDATSFLADKWEMVGATPTQTTETITNAPVALTDSVIDSRTSRYRMLDAVPGVRSVLEVTGAGIENANVQPDPEDVIETTLRGRTGVRVIRSASIPPHWMVQSGATPYVEAPRFVNDDPLTALPQEEEINNYVLLAEPGHTLTQKATESLKKGAHIAIDYHIDTFLRVASDYALDVEDWIDDRDFSYVEIQLDADNVSRGILQVKLTHTASLQDYWLDQDGNWSTTEEWINIKADAELTRHTRTRGINLPSQIVWGPIDIRNGIIAQALPDSGVIELTMRGATSSAGIITDNIPNKGLVVPCVSVFQLTYQLQTDEECENMSWESLHQNIDNARFSQEVQESEWPIGDIGDCNNHPNHTMRYLNGSDEWNPTYYWVLSPSETQYNIHQLRANKLYEQRQRQVLGADLELRRDTFQAIDRTFTEGGIMYVPAYVRVNLRTGRTRVIGNELYDPDNTRQISPTLPPGPLAPVPSPTYRPELLPVRGMDDQWDVRLRVNHGGNTSAINWRVYAGATLKDSGWLIVDKNPKEIILNSIANRVTNADGIKGVVLTLQAWSEWNGSEGTGQKSITESFDLPVPANGVPYVFVQTSNVVADMDGTYFLDIVYQGDPDTQSVKTIYTIPGGGTEEVVMNARRGTVRVNPNNKLATGAATATIQGFAETDAMGTAGPSTSVTFDVPGEFVLPDNVVTEDELTGRSFILQTAEDVVTDILFVPDETNPHNTIVWNDGTPDDPDTTWDPSDIMTDEGLSEITFIGTGNTYHIRSGSQNLLSTSDISGAGDAELVYAYLEVMETVAGTLTPKADETVLELQFTTDASVAINSANKLICILRGYTATTQIVFFVPTIGSTPPFVTALSVYAYYISAVMAEFDAMTVNRILYLGDTGALTNLGARDDTMDDPDGTDNTPEAYRLSNSGLRFNIVGTTDADMTARSKSLQFGGTFDTDTDHARIWGTRLPDRGEDTSITFGGGKLKHVNIQGHVYFYHQAFDTSDLHTDFGLGFQDVTQAIVDTAGFSGSGRLYRVGSDLYWNGSLLGVAYTAGAGLTLTGTEFAVTNPVPAFADATTGYVLKIVENAGTKSLEWAADATGTAADGNDFVTAGSYASGTITLTIPNQTSVSITGIPQGDITGVTAGNGLTGGGTSGDVSLAVGAGTGITVNANDVAVTNPLPLAFPTPTEDNAGQVLTVVDSDPDNTGTEPTLGWADAPGGVGTITGVTAGAGLTGGGTSGTPSLALDPTRTPVFANVFSYDDDDDDYVAVVKLNNNSATWTLVQAGTTGQVLSVASDGGFEFATVSISGSDLGDLSDVTDGSGHGVLVKQPMATGWTRLAAGTNDTYLRYSASGYAFAAVAAGNTYAAGSGLTLTGTTFAVGQGTGITVNANDVAVTRPVPSYDATNANQVLKVNGAGDDIAWAAETGGGGTTITGSEPQAISTFTVTAGAIAAGSDTDITATAIGTGSYFTLATGTDAGKIIVTNVGTYRLYGEITGSGNNRTAPSLTVDGDDVRVVGYDNPYLRDADADIAVLRFVDFVVEAANAVVTLKVANRDITSTGGSGSDVPIESFSLTSVDSLEIMALGGTKGDKGDTATYTAGTGLTLTGTEFAVTRPVPSGGTLGQVLKIASNDVLEWADDATGTAADGNDFVTAGSYSSGTITLTIPNQTSVSITGIPQGDITGVTAGNGLTGGGTSGAVSLAVGAGTGITVNANDVAVENPLPLAFPTTGESNAGQFLTVADPDTENTGDTVTLAWAALTIPDALPTYDSTNAGQVLKVNSAGDDVAWAADTDTDTTYTGGDGIDISNANVIVVDLATNSGLEFSSNTLQVDAGTGITVGSGGVSVTRPLPSYDATNANQVLKVNGAGSAVAWAAETGGGGGTTVTGSEPQAISTFTVTAGAIAAGADTAITATAIGTGNYFTLATGTDAGKIIMTNVGTYRLYGEITGSGNERTGPGFIVEGDDVRVVGYDNPYLRDADSDLTIVRYVDFVVEAANAVVTISVINRQVVASDRDAILIMSFTLTSVDSLEIMALGGTKGDKGDTATYTAGTGLTLTGTEFAVTNPVPAFADAMTGYVLKIVENAGTKSLEWAADATGTAADGNDFVTAGSYSSGTITLTIPNQTSVSITGIPQGDITGVTAGNGLTGGGTSGAVSLAVGAGTGITVSTNDVAVTRPVPTFAESNHRQVLMVIDDDPDTPDAGTVTTEWTQIAYSDISGTPTIPENTDTTYTAGSGMTLTGTVFSVDNPISAAELMRIPTLPTSSEGGKVWKTDADGNPAWRDDEVGMPGTGEANVQSNWTLTDTTSDAFILNKPTLPSDATTAGNYVFMQIATGDPVSVAGQLATLHSSLAYSNGVLSVANPVSAPAESDHRRVLMAIDADTDNTGDVPTMEWTQIAYSDISGTPTIPENTDTTYTAGTGMTLTGTVFSVDVPVPGFSMAMGGQVLKVVDTAGTLSIDWQDDTDTTYTAGDGMTLTDTVFSVDNPVDAPGESDHRRVLMAIDSDTDTADTDVDMEWTQVAFTDISGMIADGQIPAAIARDTELPTAGTGITASGTAFNIDVPVPSFATAMDGQVLKVSVSGQTRTIGWAADADTNTDTTYTAGDGLTLTGTTFAVGAGTGITVAANTVSVANPVSAPAESDHRRVLMAIDADTDNTGDVPTMEWTQIAYSDISGTPTIPTNTNDFVTAGSYSSGTITLTIPNQTSVSITGIPQGDITGVTAGNGLTGGGTSGDVSLAVGAGTGITVAANTVSVANPLPDTPSIDNIGDLLRFVVIRDTSTTPDGFDAPEWITPYEIFATGGSGVYRDVPDHFDLYQNNDRLNTVFITRIRLSRFQTLPDWDTSNNGQFLSVTGDTTASLTWTTPSTPGTLPQTVTGQLPPTVQPGSGPTNVALGTAIAINVTAVGASEEYFTAATGDDAGKIIIKTPGTYKFWSEMLIVSAENRTGPGVDVTGTGVNVLGYDNPYLRDVDTVSDQLWVSRHVEFSVTTPNTVVTLRVVHREVLDGDVQETINLFAVENNGLRNLHILPIGGTQGAASSGVSLPAYTSANDGQVLGVSAGTLAWVAGGGSGTLPTLGTAGQVLTVNSGATASAWADLFSVDRFIRGSGANGRRRLIIGDGGHSILISTTNGSGGTSEMASMTFGSGAEISINAATTITTTNPRFVPAATTTENAQVLTVVGGVPTWSAGGGSGSSATRLLTNHDLTNGSVELSDNIANYEYFDVVVQHTNGQQYTVRLKRDQLEPYAATSRTISGLYTIDGQTLYSLNASNGEASAVLKLSGDPIHANSTYREQAGLAFGDNAFWLYAIASGDTTGHIYKINAANGTVTDLGDTGFDSGHSIGLEYAGTTLYLYTTQTAGGSTGSLYSVHQTSGATTLLGTESVALFGGAGLAYTGSTMYLIANKPPTSIFSNVRNVHRWTLNLSNGRISDESNTLWASPINVPIGAAYFNSNTYVILRVEDTHEWELREIVPGEGSNLQFPRRGVLPFEHNIGGLAAGSATVQANAETDLSRFVRYDPANSGRQLAVFTDMDNTDHLYIYAGTGSDAPESISIYGVANI